MRQIGIFLFFILISIRPLLGADASAYYVQANQFYAQRDFSTSLELYRKSMALNPQSGNAIWGEANCLYMLGQKQQALDAYRQAHAAIPDQAQITARIAQIEAELQPSLPTLPPVAVVQNLPNVRPNASWFSPLWRSALLPGWGQAYNGQSTKAWLLGGATWGTFAGVVGSYIGGLGALDDYHKTTDPAVAVDKYNEAYGYYTANQTFYILFGFAYIYNIFDAALNAGTHTEQTAYHPAPIQMALLPGGVILAKEWSW